MVSKGREYDREIRKNLMEVIGVQLRMYKKTGNEKFLENARSFGEQSAELKKRIETYDYKVEDERLAFGDELDRRWKGTPE